MSKLLSLGDKHTCLQIVKNKKVIINHNLIKASVENFCLSYKDELADVCTIR